MTRPASRLVFNPPRGLRPSLEFRRVDELLVDQSYQRSLETSRAQKLVNLIARDWDWGLCQPLVVARRPDGAMMIVDGQHRLAAAKLRGDIVDLPCVVLPYGSVGAEAAAFVSLNQHRRPLSKLELFQAALVGGDEISAEIMQLIEAAGLSLARHSNYIAWKPGEISNISGIQRCFRSYGKDVTAAALAALTNGFPNQVLRYGGTIFAGVAIFLANSASLGLAVDEELLAMVLEGATQEEWYSDILLEAASSGCSRSAAAPIVIGKAYDEASTEMAEAA
jgi:hypothetical protein